MAFPGSVLTMDDWYAIDVQNKGWINAQELWMYMKKQRIEDREMNKFMNLFDLDGDGRVTLEEFTTKLRLTSTTRMRVSGMSLPAGVEFISGDMEISWQIKMAQLCIDGLRSTAAMKDVPKWIKIRADELHSKLWHVVAVNGQFWCFYGHEPGYSFVFRYEKYIFIIWKTPCE